MKKIILTLLLVFSGFLIWYLAIKPYDYLVTIESKTFPGVINQTIKTWNYTQKGAKIEPTDDLNTIRQIIPFNDSTFLYQWKIETLNDSVSVVKVYITDLDHSIKNRLSNPFFHTDFEKRVKNSLTGFNKNLNEHLSKFRVEIIGESQIEEKFCAYIPIQSKQIEKARGMMQYFGLLDNAMAENELQLDGRPFLIINEWDMKNDKIQYDFCFPIVDNDTLFEHPDILFKKIESKKALKATYNGNYISSDRAWYALLDYAEKNNIEVDRTPIEIFHNNPNMGGDELQWTTEVLMPLDLD